MTFRVARRLQARGFPNRRRPHDDIPGGRGFPAPGQFSMPGREVRNDAMGPALAASPEHAGWLRSHGHAATFAVPMSVPGLMALAGKLDRECVAALRARPDEILAIAGRHPDDDAVCRNEGMSC